MKDILVTCPPMLRRFDHYVDEALTLELRLHAVQTSQILSVDELSPMLPNYDGWIIGDDPTTHDLLSIARQGRLRAAIKWGVGTDNIDFEAFSALQIPVQNTPGMFGVEVAELALGYAIALNRQLIEIDREVRRGNWHKPSGYTLSEMHVGVVGYGDIGRHLVSLLSAFTSKITVYDPFISPTDLGRTGSLRAFPDELAALDALFMTCALTPDNQHMLNTDTLGRLQSCNIINVSRGPLIDESALIDAMQSGHVRAAALDVFETEPLPSSSPLLNMPGCILGSHNGSNTYKAVDRTSRLAIKKMAGLLYGH